MRVLVTGHKGYIGTVLVRMLCERGYQVSGVDSGYYRGCDFGDPPPSIPSLRKDVRDVTASDLAGVDAIIHLAALSNDPLGELNPAWTEEINCLASVRLAELAKGAGVERFLFSSSCSIYGAGGSEDLLAEDARLRPVSAYAVSKVKTEQALAKLADERLSPVFLRNATAYGVSPRMRFDLVLNNLLGWAFTTGKVRILSDGTPWRPLVHVEDIARAFIAALEAPRERIHNQAFNVGRTSQNFQVRDIARVVQETVPDSTTEYVGQSSPDPRSYRVDFGRIAQELPAFSPQWTLEAGTRELYEACLDVGLTHEQFQSRTYFRVRQLCHLLDQQRLDDTLRWRRS